MAICKSCGDEADELVTVTVNGKRRRLCEDCAQEARSAEQIAEQSEAIVQQMMGFKGRRE
jgi:ribosome-binding protein aMBF1 (putative translation factor)